MFRVEVVATVAASKDVVKAEDVLVAVIVEEQAAEDTRTSLRTAVARKP